MSRTLYEFIVEFIDEYEYSPSYREMADAVGLSVSTVKTRLDELASEGRITYVPHLPRTVRYCK